MYQYWQTISSNGVKSNLVDNTNSTDRSSGAKQYPSFLTSVTSKMCSMYADGARIGKSFSHSTFRTAFFYKLKLKFALGKFEIVYLQDKYTHGITFGKQSIENDRLVTNAIEM